MCRVWRAIIVLGLSILFQVWAIVCLGLIISIPPLVSSPFPTILSVWRVPASLSCCLGVHGWVTRICQPRDLSPSWSWLHADSGSSWMILMHFDMVSQIWPYQKSKLQFIIIPCLPVQSKCTFLFLRNLIIVILAISRYFDHTTLTLLKIWE